MATAAEIDEAVRWVKEHKKLTHGNIAVIIGDQRQLLDDVKKLQVDVAAMKAALRRLTSTECLLEADGGPPGRSRVTAAQPSPF